MAATSLDGVAASKTYSDDGDNDSPILAILNDGAGNADVVNLLIAHLVHLHGLDGTKATALNTLGIKSLGTDDGTLIREQKHVYYITTGAADAYVVTPDPAITVLKEGLKTQVKIHETSLTTIPTLEYGDTPVTFMKGPAGADPAPGDFKINQIVDLVCVDIGGTFHWQVTSSLPVATSSPNFTKYWQNTTDSWISPNGVTKIFAAVIAGAGGARTTGGSPHKGGDGGAAWGFFNVIPGEIYDIIAGAGGVSGTSIGAAGTSSSFSLQGGGTLLSAGPGAGGTGSGDGAAGLGTGGVINSRSSISCPKAWVAAGLQGREDRIGVGQFAELAHPGMGGIPGTSDTRGSHGIVYIVAINDGT